MGNPALGQELAQATSCSREPCQAPACSTGRGAHCEPRTPLSRSTPVEIPTCVLSSCLWSRGGGLCCGCGSGSGGACVGRGTGSETSAAPGRPIWSAAASAPESVICREQSVSASHLTPEPLSDTPEQQTPTAPAPSSPAPTHTAGSSLLLGLVLPTKCQWVIQFAYRKSCHYYCKHLARARAELATLHHSQVRPV